MSTFSKASQSVDEQQLTQFKAASLANLTQKNEYIQRNELQLWLRQNYSVVVIVMKLNNT